MSATVTLDSPREATLPSFWSSASTPYDSAAGTCGSSRCSWSRSSRSVFSLRRASSVCCRRYSGRPTGRQIPGPGRTRPALVAIRRPSAYGCKASARISSLTFGPYESAVSMKSTPSSTARRATLTATARSAGSPQMPGPVRRIAPKPRRWTGPRSLTSKVPLLRAGVADVMAATTHDRRPLFQVRAADSVLVRGPTAGLQVRVRQGSGPVTVALAQGTVERGVLHRHRHQVAVLAQQPPHPAPGARVQLAQQPVACHRHHGFVEVGARPAGRRGITRSGELLLGLQVRGQHRQLVGAPPVRRPPE